LPKPDSSAVGRIRDRESLARITADIRKRGGKVAFTNGCFDLLHVGHIRYLEEAAKLGTILVVGLNSDISVENLKGPRRPLVPQRERAEMLAALRSVDYVCIFDEPTPRELILALRPDILIKGGDYRRDELAGGPEVEGWGGRVVLAPEVAGKSTRNLIEKIARLYRSPERNREG